MPHHTRSHAGQPVSLRDAIDRLFDEAFTFPGFARPEPTTRFQPGVSTIPCNLYEDDQSFYLYCLLPGVRPEDINVTYEEGMLTISGEIQTMAKEGARPLLQEIRQCTYRRELRLPTEFDIDKAQASFGDGVLYLTLPKAPRAVPRRVPVQSGRAVK